MSSALAGAAFQQTIEHHSSSSLKQCLRQVTLNEPSRQHNDRTTVYFRAQRHPRVSDIELQAHRRILPRLGLSVKLANRASPKLLLTLLDCTLLQRKLSILLSITSLFSARFGICAVVDSIVSGHLHSLNPSHELHTQQDTQAQGNTGPACGRRTTSEKGSAIRHR